VLMGFPQQIATIYTLTAYEWTQSELYAVCHLWNVVPHCRPLNYGGHKHGLQLTCHCVIWGCIISCKSKPTVVVQFKMIKYVLQINGLPCSSIMGVDLSSLINIQNWKRIAN
jgi:hypothetical protein